MHLKQANKKIDFIEMLATKANLKLALTLNPDILHITCHGSPDSLKFEKGYDDEEEEKKEEQSQKGFSDKVLVSDEELRQIFQ